MPSFPSHSGISGRGDLTGPKERGPHRATRPRRQQRAARRVPYGCLTRQYRLEKRIEAEQWRRTPHGARMSVPDPILDPNAPLWDDMKRDERGASCRLRYLKGVRFGIGRHAETRPSENFETAPFGEATPINGVIRALHAGSFFVASSNRLSEWRGSPA